MLVSTRREDLVVKGSEGHETDARPKRRGGGTPSSSVAGGVVASHLFDCWPQVVRSIRSAQRVALFLDFDGTLAALRRLPSDVKPLDPSLRTVLRRLAEHKRLALYVISGRRLAELRRLVPVKGVRLLGLHGWEGRRTPHLRAERDLLRRARQVLERRLSSLPEIRLEDKGLALAVHYRGAAPRTAWSARVIVREVLSDLKTHVHMLRGHKVWELLPRQISGKGSSVLALLSGLPQPTLAIFVGDDGTDESAFRALPSALTIRVGKRPRTAARFLLKSPDEVKSFLQRLDAVITAGSKASSAP